MEYALLDKNKVDVYKDYLTPEAYSRRNEDSVFYYGAICEGKIVGVAAFAADGESELLSVAVSPKWQKQGIGSELVDGIVDMVKACGSTMLETILVVQDDKEEGIDKFLWRCGFNEEEEHLVGGFTFKDVKNNDVIKKIRDKKLPEQVKSLSQVSKMEARDFGSSLMKKGIYPGWETGSFNERLSSVYMERGRISACLLFSDEGDDVNLEFAYVDPQNRNQLIFLYLVANSILKAESDYAEDTKIWTVAMNETSEELLKKLLGDHLKTERLVSYTLRLSK
ncbi:MAG: GNAT family N-acetyltransferase [Lachnospiraceae bacterium]